jgi:thiol-disulfide isomerase/thioredoxin
LTLLIVGLLVIGGVAIINVSGDELEAPLGMPAAVHAYSGRTLPNFQLRELTRRKLGRSSAKLLSDDHRTAADYAGKVLVINFWASWCVPCKAEHADLNDVARRYRGRDVEVLGIIYEDAPTNALRYLAEETDLAFPVLVEGRSSLARALGVRGIPQTFVVDRKRVVRAWFPSLIAPAQLTAAIDSALVAPTGDD